MFRSIHIVVLLFYSMFLSQSVAQDGETMCQPLTVGEPSTRIVGGQRARISEWPGFASLSILPKNKDDPSLHFCGATAIAKDWLVTAAHCVRSTKDVIDGEGEEAQQRILHKMRVNSRTVVSGNLFATLNTDNLADSGQIQTIPIERVIVHPEYDRSAVKQNDIALLKLSKSWQGEIARVDLGSSSNELRGRAFVAGFGLTSDPRDPDTRSSLRPFNRSSGRTYFSGSDRLLAALVPPIAHEECAQKNPGHIDRDSEFCAGFASGTRDSCNADSGGPIVQIDKNGCPYLVGIVQSGQWCGTRKQHAATYGIYTRLDAYSDFISEHVGAVRVPSGPAETDHDAMLETARKIGGWAELIPDRVNIKMNRIPAPGAPETSSPSDIAKFFDGDGMYLEVNSFARGRMIVLNMAPDGTLSHIFPSNGPSQLIFWTNQGNPFYRRLPDEGQIFPASAPYGEGRILLLVAPLWTSFDFRDERLSRVSDPTSYILDQLVLALSDKRNTDDYSGWGIAIQPYEILAKPPSN